MLNLRLPLPRFLSAGEIVSGAGSIGALRALEAAKVAALVSPSFLRAPDTEPILTKSIRAEALRIVPMPGGEPTLAALGPVIAELDAFAPDWIVAAGGGSAIDGAKLAWVFHEHPDADLDRITRPFGLPPLRGRCRFAAVPTTAGTGSEVSSAALFFDPATGTKRAIVSHHLLPDLAVLDPKLTVGVPASVVAEAGLDALAHALEGYVSRFDNPLVDLFAEQAAALLFQSLTRTQREPENLAVRLDVMHAATMAGWVQNLKVPGIGHAVAHQLARFGVSHGRAVGCLLPWAIRYNLLDAAVTAKYERLARACGLERACDLPHAVEVLARELALAPLRLPRAQVESDLAVIAARALEDPCARANPRPFEAADIARMIVDGCELMVEGSVKDDGPDGAVQKGTRGSP